MKLVMILIPLLLFAATREECAKKLAAFEPLEKSYDAVVEAGMASPVSEKIIRDFRKEGGDIYRECKDRMSTTRWYMLGRKIDPGKVNIAKFHLPSLTELKQYAINHPPVVIDYRCGTVIQGGRQPRPGLLGR